MDTLKDPAAFDRAQPRWTSSQEGDEYMIKAEGIVPAAVPGQRIVGTIRDPKQPGYTVQVSVPHLPYERWIDDAGNVCSCPVRTNRVRKKGSKQSVDDGNYSTQVTTRAFAAANWVRFDDGFGRNAREIPDWTPEARQRLIDERQDLQRQRSQVADLAFLDKKKTEAQEIQKALTDALRSFSEEGKADRERRAAKRTELEK